MEQPRLNISPVVFHEENHTYTLDGKYLKGVTSTLVRRAYPHTYDTPAGMSEELWQKKLSAAAAKGTAVHQAIELYEDLGVENDMPELRNYISLKKNNGFVNLATEYIVSDEKHYASAIDHVFCTEDGEEIILVDIKHTSEIKWDDVTCQLSVYKRFFELQNPHLKDRRVSIALLWLRGDKIEFRILSVMADEVLDALIEADLKDESFDIQQHYGDLPVKFADAEGLIAQLDTELKEKKAQYEKLTKGLFELMLSNGVQKFTGSKVQLTVTKATKRESFDKDAFKFDHADLYEQYKTYTDVKPSLRITIKK